MDEWFYTAYRHTNGSIHVKRSSSMELAQELIDQFSDSNYVDDFIMPYRAGNRAQAEVTAKEKLSLNRPVARDT